MRRSRPGPATGLGAALVALVALLPGTASAAAQEPDSATPATCGDRWIQVPALSGPYADYARAAELLGRAPLRQAMLRNSASDRVLTLCGAGGPWTRRAEPTPTGAGPTLTLLPIATVLEFNSAYPADRNNGARWAGRGATSALSGGAHLRWGPLSAQLAPELTYQQNRAFTIRPARIDTTAGWSPFLYGGHPGLIDLPQRHGDGAFSTVEPGQSFLRVDAFGVAAGVSTENLWWGPALDQPIMLGGSAPGFPHAFLGSSEPVGIGIGLLGVSAFWGRIAESDYFDSDPDNDHRIFAGLGVSFQPAGVEGLTLGAGRTYMGPMSPDSTSAWDFFFEPYYALARNRDDDNEMLNVFVRWAFPGSGFEMYGEWAREDHWADVNDLLAEPDHTLGYLVGLQKAASLEAGWLRVHGELFRLQIGTAPYRSSRGITTFYTHNKLPQGYTHRGQMLGAPAGPGSGGERVAADLFTDWGLVGVFAARTHYDDDAYYSRHLIQGRTRGDNRDRELTVGVRHLHFLGDFDVSWSASYSHRTNRGFIGLYRDGDGNYPEGNWGLELGAAWRPHRAARGSGS